MSLDLKEKELVAVSASVAAGCKPCTNYHFKKVRETGASDEEIKQTISDAMCVRDSAKKIMEAQGLKHMGIVKDVDDCGCSDSTTRIKELVSVAAAFAVNCSSNLEKHITTARNINISDDEIRSALDLTFFIKGKAASHVDRIVERIGNNVSSPEEIEDTGECGCSDDSEAAAPGTKKGIVAAVVAGEQDDCGGDC